MYVCDTEAKMPKKQKGQNVMFIHGVLSKLRLSMEITNVIFS